MAGGPPNEGMTVKNTMPGSNTTVTIKMNRSSCAAHPPRKKACPAIRISADRAWTPMRHKSVKRGFFLRACLGIAILVQDILVRDDVSAHAKVTSFRSHFRQWRPRNDAPPPTGPDRRRLAVIPGCHKPHRESRVPGRRADRLVRGICLTPGPLRTLSRHDRVRGEPVRDPMPENRPRPSGFPLALHRFRRDGPYVRDIKVSAIPDWIRSNLIVPPAASRPGAQAQSSHPPRPMPEYHGSR